MEAISQAGAAVGIITRSGVTIAAERRILSKVQIFLKPLIYFDKLFVLQNSKAPWKQWKRKNILHKRAYCCCCCRDQLGCEYPSKLRKVSTCIQASRYYYKIFTSGLLHNDIYLRMVSRYQWNSLYRHFVIKNKDILNLEAWDHTVFPSWLVAG